MNDPRYYNYDQDDEDIDDLYDDYYYYDPGVDSWGHYIDDDEYFTTQEED